MKKLKLITLFTLLGAFAATQVQAQLELPAPSPKASVSQMAGLTNITIDYSSPAVNGRQIWGGLVPYNELWRTGANAATKVTFSRDVTIDGKNVPAGSYSLFTIPAQDEWTIILNKEANLAGTTGYSQDKDLLRMKVKPQTVPHRERMTFIISDFNDKMANIDLEWEKMRIRIPVTLSTGDQAMKNIDNALNNTWRTYANAARYALETTKNYDQGLKWIDQSLALNSDWFNNWIKAELLNAKGQTKEALTYAQKAKELGDKSENFFYKNQVEKALNEWKAKK